MCGEQKSYLFLFASLYGFFRTVVHARLAGRFDRTSTLVIAIFYEKK